MGIFPNTLKAATPPCLWLHCDGRFCGKGGPRCAWFSPSHYRRTEDWRPLELEPSSTSSSPITVASGPPERVASSGVVGDEVRLAQPPLHVGRAAAKLAASPDGYRSPGGLRTAPSMVGSRHGSGRIRPGTGVAWREAFIGQLPHPSLCPVPTRSSPDLMFDAASTRSCMRHRTGAAALAVDFLVLLAGGPARRGSCRGGRGGRPVG